MTLARIFEEAGLPDGVFHVLPGGVDVGEALVTDPNVAMVSFTGSSRAGRAVAALGGQHLKKIHLELGGNNALIILDDVDIERASSVGAWGSFVHQGQVCMTTGRHLVRPARSPRTTSTRWPSMPTTCRSATRSAGTVALGPIIDAKQRDKVHRIVTGSVAAGARLAAGGTYDGLFYRPTVLADVPQGVSGVPAGGLRPGGAGHPVRLDRRGGRDGVGHRVRLDRRHSHQNVLRGLEIAERIPTGIIHVNDQTIGDEVTNPFGGVKASGTGARLAVRRRTSKPSLRRSG